MTKRNEKMTPEALENRLIDVAVRIGNVADALPDNRLEKHIANQIVRSGTSAAPKYAEGCAAESRRDFAHKLSIGLKELRETNMGRASSGRRIFSRLDGCATWWMNPISSARFFHGPSTRLRKSSVGHGPPLVTVESART